jgi:hypothetical protein
VLYGLQVPMDAIFIYLFKKCYIAPLQGRLLRSTPGPTTAKLDSFEFLKEQSVVTHGN